MDNGWAESTYRAHESGMRTIGQDDAERYAKRFRAKGADVSAQSILFDAPVEAPPNAGRTLDIMGRVGAGAEIDTDFEQAPPEGFDQVELPYSISDELVGYRVKGDSMLPAYEPDEIIAVDRVPASRVENLVGDRVVVLAEGPNGEKLRYLKRIRRRRDQKPGTFDLESINDRSPTLKDVKIIEACAVRMAIPNIGVRWLKQKARSTRSKAGRA